MPSEPRSPTRASRRHGTHRADDTWVPGTLPEAGSRSESPQGDGAAAAALELLAERTEPENEVEVDAEAASIPADDDRPIGELIEDLAALNETPADPNVEDAE